MNKIWAILIISSVIILIIRFVACRFFDKCILFNDMLKEKGPDGLFRYSQGRVYLLCSLLAYFITLGLLTSKALKPNIGIDSGTITQIIDALQWSILLMASYVFGGKGLEIVKLLMNRGKGGDSSQTPPPGQ